MASLPAVQIEVRTPDDQPLPKKWRSLAFKVIKQGWVIIALKGENARLNSELKMYRDIISSAATAREAYEKATAAHQVLFKHLSQGTGVQIGQDYKIGHSRRVP